jgi:MinD superfamily P-loop ATPase
MKRVLQALLFCASLVMLSAAAGKAIFKVDSETCMNCGACTEVCAAKAISPHIVNGKEAYVIDPQKCTGCGACGLVCPVEAIGSDSLRLGDGGRRPISPQVLNSKP